MKGRIETLIKQVIDTCMPWIKEKDDVIQYVDPLDNMEITAHYGATHVAVALLIFGKEKNDRRLVQKGESLLFSIMERWGKSKQLAGFHNDFNNFALCVLDSYITDYHESIKEIVLGTSDSIHDTVNWLPMRWYVNKCRYEWTGNKKYEDNCRICAEKIKSATYSDGFIDDRLPLGLSFNLQYDVATVAVMQFLRTSGEKMDLSKETGALINAVCPDGDINYFGRGTNQIFAWGLWIYLLASSGQKEVEHSLEYLENKLPNMLKNKNLMLNDYPGEEKYMWWDYHYCSVYLAHFLFWLVMAYVDEKKAIIYPKIVNNGSSGIHIYRNNNVFVATFDGRTEYLAEKGPLVVAAWTKKTGVIFKGAFGPWQGAFGNKHMQKGITLNNYVGIAFLNTEYDWSKNRIVKKLFPKIKMKEKESFIPSFVPPQIEIDKDIKIVYKLKVSKALLNVAGKKE